MNGLERAEKLFGTMGTFFLATMREDGTPDVRAISAVKADGLRTIWMISGGDCVKAGELAANPRCMIYATTMDDDADYAEVRLWGRCEILSDAATIDSVWLDGYAAYFPAGKNDPNVRIFRFTTENGYFTTQEGRVEI